MGIITCKYVEINIILLIGCVLLHDSHHLIIHTLFNTFLLSAYFPSRNIYWRRIEKMRITLLFVVFSLKWGSFLVSFFRFTSQKYVHIFIHILTCIGFSFPFITIPGICKYHVAAKFRCTDKSMLTGFKISMSYCGKPACKIVLKNK